MYMHVHCLFALLWLGNGIQAVLLDAPSYQNFGCRRWPTATVLGSHVYIEGGEISQLEDGKEPLVIAPVNSTLSIDISKSWNSKTVSIRTITKPPGIPSRTMANIWTNAAALELYSWGGTFRNAKDIVQAQVLKFTADGNGGGSWGVQNLENANILKTLHPSRGGAFASANETGFLIGGQANNLTELNRKDQQNIPGMLTFDMKTKTLQNITSTSSSAGDSGSGSGFPFKGALVWAEAEYVPNFGPNGLVMVFGGHDAPLDNSIEAYDTQPLGFETLRFFDPRTGEWFSQKTTGTAPFTPRMNFCVTGFQTTSGYDIFVYGGYREQGTKPVFGSSYILSLPGFVWTQVPDAPEGRQGHACVSVGNRQVLSIGGSTYGWATRDKAPQGLSLFDMTSLEWKYEYDADAGPYERSDRIKEWYKNGSLASVQWSSDKVRTLFAISETSEPVATPGPDPNSSPTPVGAIVGGVLGGVGVLALIAGIAWWLLRFRRRTRHEGPEVEAEAVGEKTSLNVPDAYKYAHEVSGQRGYSELASGRRRAELAGSSTELVELPANPKY